MARGNAITKTCEACGTAFTARTADIARGWGRYCSMACKAKQQGSVGTENTLTENQRNNRDAELRGIYDCYVKMFESDPCDARQKPMCSHVEDMATQNGWNRGDGEGAIEFLMRNAYETGRKDALQEQRPALMTIDSAALDRARKAYSSATGIGTSKTGMFAALKAAREPQDGQG